MSAIHHNTPHLPHFTTLVSAITHTCHVDLAPAPFLLENRYRPKFKEANVRSPRLLDPWLRWRDKTTVLTCKRLTDTVCRSYTCTTIICRRCLTTWRCFVVSLSSFWRSTGSTKCRLYSLAWPKTTPPRSRTSFSPAIRYCAHTGDYVSNKGKGKGSAFV